MNFFRGLLIAIGLSIPIWIGLYVIGITLFRGLKGGF